MLLIALAAMWGSSFMFNKLSVATVPPATVVAGRLTIAALILLMVMHAQRLRLPPPGRIWVSYAALAMIGNAIPFFLITWGQKVVDSALAGILMAIMPLATLLLAHFFVAGERLSRNRLAGFALGFGGIVVLMGPAALTGLGGSPLQAVSQLAVLCAALCYAANSVLARRTIRDGFLVASAATLLLASALMLPLALVIDQPWSAAPSASSVAAIVWLGIGPTAVATICYFALISSAGPTFMSLVNYISPVVAVICGVALVNEHPGTEAYVALILVLAGIALSQLRRRP
ncbi:MAG: DMT family transporter [Burkholderiales bacterium]|nr:DMT family transporter [Burkholderiales bacterium]